MVDKPVEKLSPVEEQAFRIVDVMDSSRILYRGGYPSAVRIENGTVYMATVDYEDAPVLIIQQVDEFIDERGYWLE